LAKRVTNQFPEWNIVGIISAKELERKKDLTEIDLVLSTVKLTMPIDKPVAYVSALFNKTDVNRIKELLVQGYQPVAQLTETEREAPCEEVNGSFHIDSAEAACLERIVLKKSELCVWEKKAGEKEARVAVLKDRDAGKQRWRLVIGSGEALSDALLRNAYCFALKAENE
jgi:activator of the mannose operon, transcriptional antiterminator